MGERRGDQPRPPSVEQPPAERHAIVDVQVPDWAAEDEVRRGLPRLFDVGTFFEVKRNLHDLKRVGIDEIKIGQRMYSTDDVIAMVERVDDLSSGVRNGQIKMEEGGADAYLATMGVTRGKISAESEKGFRQCMLDCMNNDRRTILDMPVLGEE